MMKKELQTVTTDEQRTEAGLLPSASLVQNGMLCAGRVYVIEVDKGAWDDWSWWIHGIYDCPIKADEAKRKLLAKIEADKLDKRWVVAHHAKSINEVQVKEYKLNEVASR